MPQIAEEGEAGSSISSVQQELFDIHSSFNVHIDATEAKPSEIPFLGASRNFRDKSNELDGGLPDGKASVGDIGLLKQANLTPKSVAPPQESKLQVSEKYETEDVKLEDLIEPHAISLGFGNDVALEEDNKPSLPLAGVNVMNILFVAAECGPWSKTGEEISVIFIGVSSNFCLHICITVRSSIIHFYIYHRRSWRCCWSFAKGFS